MALFVILLVVCWFVCLRRMLVRMDEFNFHLFVAVSITLCLFSVLLFIGG